MTVKGWVPLFDESSVPGNGSGDTGKPPRRQVNSPTMISSVNRMPVTRHEYLSKFGLSQRFSIFSRRS